MGICFQGFLVPMLGNESLFGSWGPFFCSYGVAVTVVLSPAGSEGSTKMLGWDSGSGVR